MSQSAIDLRVDPGEGLAGRRGEVVPEPEEVREEQGREEAAAGTCEGGQLTLPRSMYLCRQASNSRVLECDGAEEDAAKDADDLDERNEQHRLLVVRLHPELQSERGSQQLRQLAFESTCIHAPGWSGRGQ